jgi:hypothetical protein
MGKTKLVPSPGCRTKLLLKDREHAEEQKFLLKTMPKDKDHVEEQKFLRKNRDHAEGQRPCYRAKVFAEGPRPCLRTKVLSEGPRPWRRTVLKSMRTTKISTEKGQRLPSWPRSTPSRENNDKYNQKIWPLTPGSVCASQLLDTMGRKRRRPWPNTTT